MDYGIDADALDGDQIVLARLAQSEVFSTREKIELLRSLKAGMTGEQTNPAAIGFDAVKIDDTLEAVRQQAERGEGPDPVPRSVAP